MKRTIHIAMSLDGYIADADGGIAWLENLATDPKVSERVLAFIAESELIVMGRRTYAHVLSFPEWPHPDKQTIVVSESLTSVTTPDTIIATPEGLLAAMAATGAQKIWIVGGGVLNGYMLEHGMVDAITVTVAPILLGAGVPMFAGMSHFWPLQLQEVVPLGCGFVELNYTITLPC